MTEFGFKPCDRLITVALEPHLPQSSARNSMADMSKPWRIKGTEGKCSTHRFESHGLIQFGNCDFFLLKSNKSALIWVQSSGPWFQSNQFCCRSRAGPWFPGWHEYLHRPAGSFTEQTSLLHHIYSQIFFFLSHDGPKHDWKFLNS